MCVCVSYPPRGHLRWHSCAACHPALAAPHTYSKTFPVYSHTLRQYRCPHSDTHHYLQRHRDSVTTSRSTDRASPQCVCVCPDRCTPAAPCRSRIRWDSNRRSRECCSHTHRLYTPPDRTAYTRPHLSGPSTLRLETTHTETYATFLFVCLFTLVAECSRFHGNVPSSAGTQRLEFG